MLFELLSSPAVLGFLAVALATYAYLSADEWKEWASGLKVTMAIGSDPYAFFSKLQSEGKDFHRIVPGSVGGRKTYIAFDANLVRDIYAKGNSSTSSKHAAVYFDHVMFDLSKTWLANPQVFDECEKILYRVFSASGLQEPAQGFVKCFEDLVERLTAQVEEAGSKTLNLHGDFTFEIHKCFNIGFFGPKSPAHETTEAIWRFSADFNLIGATSIAPLPLWLGRKIISPAPWKGMQDCQRHFQRWLDEDGHLSAVTPWRDTLIELRDKYVTRGQLEPQDPAAITCAMLFASAANTSPVTFWTLNMIYSSPTLLSRVRAEVKALRDSHDLARISAVELPTHFPLIRSTFFEVLRTFVPAFGVRVMTKDCTFVGSSGKPLIMKKGECILLNGVWNQLDSESWTDAHIFKPDRFLGKDGQFLLSPDLFAFGGGIGICRGRQLAQYEIIYTVIRIVETFDIELGSVSDRSGKVIAPALRKMGDGGTAKTPHYAPNRFGTAALPPNGDIEATLRLRK